MDVLSSSWHDTSTAQTEYVVKMSKEDSRPTKDDVKLITTTCIKP